jgi:CheY-like chemotaxis protein
VQDAAAPAPQDTAQSVPGGSEAVLLVDDEELLLDMGSRMLAGLGYRVTALQSPREALALFTQDPAAFDLVITDQTMPGLTGYELARRLLDLRPGLPVILCTGYSDLVTAESALAGGIRAFVLKPLTRQDIGRAMRQALEKDGNTP